MVAEIEKPTNVRKGKTVPSDVRVARKSRVRQLLDVAKDGPREISPEDYENFLDWRENNATKDQIVNRRNGGKTTQPRYLDPAQNGLDPNDFSRMRNRLDEVARAKQGTPIRRAAQKRLRQR